MEEVEYFRGQGPYPTNSTDIFLINENHSTSIIDYILKNGTHRRIPPAADPIAVILLSLLFCTIGIIGTFGNLMVIYVILVDRKMRRSVTNLFILNLAVADLLIMLFGIPEIVQVMLNRGWVIGVVLCRIHRYILVVSLYVSIMTLMSVCIERYIAIVHPIKAHILCSRKRILVSIGCIWPIGIIIGLPTVLYNRVGSPPGVPVEICSLIFPGDHKTKLIAFKWFEFTMFFFLPVIIQIVLYSIIGKHLFIGTERLHRKQHAIYKDGVSKEKDSDAIKARKGVVKMLIASVAVYFFSYAPVQVPLFYNMLAKTEFKTNWAFLVLVMTLGYINSAANPILYSIFSQNFRRKFALLLCRCFNKDGKYGYRPTSVAMDSYSTRTTGRFVSTKINNGMAEM